MEHHTLIGKSEKCERGFAYIALLAVLAIMALVLATASENIHLNAKREREQQLFFVGEQFRNAIASYNSKSPGGGQQFPKSLDNLLKDRRSIKPIRHLRRIYQDPMTNDSQWGLVKNEKRQIVGVYSLSTESVLITNFDANLVKVNISQNSLVYSDLKFIYTPEKIK